MIGCGSTIHRFSNIDSPRGLVVPGRVWYGLVQRRRKEQDEPTGHQYPKRHNRSVELRTRTLWFPAMLIMKMISF